MLQQNILAHHTDVRRAMTHIGGDIRAPNDYQAYSRATGFEHQLAAALNVIQRLYSDPGQQRQRLLEDAPLGQGHGQPGTHFCHAGTSALPAKLPLRRSVGSYVDRMNTAIGDTVTQGSVNQLLFLHWPEAIKNVADGDDVMPLMPEM